MTLEDFERQLAEEKDTEIKQKKPRPKDSHERTDRQERHHHHHHRHHHHHHREHKSSRTEDRNSKGQHDEHRTKRRRREDDRGHRRHSSDAGAEQSPSNEAQSQTTLGAIKRDSWMEAPSALEVDYVQRRRQEVPQTQSGSLAANYELKIHKNELNQHLKDLNQGKTLEDIVDGSTQENIDYTFGDAGSQWRMTKLKAVYRQAKESGRPVDAVALERYSNLKEFDDAREEEVEIGRRETYGREYVGKDKPSGELFRNRKQESTGVEVHRSKHYEVAKPEEIVEGIAAPSSAPTGSGQRIDQTTLNKMKASLMKARLRKDPNLEQLQQQYDEAAATFQNQDPTVITLSAMDDRMLSSAPRNEVRSVTNRRGADRGNVEENEEMSIEDMVREEKRTRHEAGGEAKRFAERIAKDGKFDNDLDYMDENAAKLAKRVHKSGVNLRNMAINEYQKTNKILDNCPLCHHEDTNTPPTAPVVSIATRTYLTLPTEPDLASFAAMIVPMQHHVNLLECDDDEWEEIRNFMKSLTRLYHDQERDVLFYENAAHPHRKPHAALVAVPLPYSLGETAPAFFKEAFLTTEDEWSQHRKIIDTLGPSKEGLGKLAFRRTLVKEMPYFHVWFELDGGLGHVVEDGNRWPKGDLFAREIIGGMLGLEPDVIKRQGRWHRGHDPRVDGFRTKWKPFDWTRILHG